MTYRETRIARAERLKGWAGKSEEKAETARAQAAEYVEATPPGQPILLGHHSQRKMERLRDRFNNNMRKEIDHTEKAKEMAGKADHILKATENSIYSDDSDAVERLKERLTSLEAERDRIKAYNRTVKGSSGDLTLLDPHQVERLRVHRSSYETGFDQGWRFPAYGLSNLSANIARVRKRLELCKQDIPINE